LGRLAPVAPLFLFLSFRSINSAKTRFAQTWRGRSFIQETALRQCRLTTPN